MRNAPTLETLLRDTRYALRILRKSPGYTVTALLTLAIAIAINTAVFSVVDGMLLRPLPYPDADRLSLVQATVEARGGRAERTSQNGTTWTVLRERATTLEAAVFSTWVSGVNVVAGPRAVHADGQKIGAGFFGVLGARPLYGREFSGEEDRRGGPPAVILGHAFWRRAFNADPAVVGSTLALRGEPHTIVGIMPADVYTGASADLWTPLRPSTDGEGSGENYQILVRTRPDVDPAAAEAEVARLGAEGDRARQLPDGVSITYGLVPLQQGLTDALRRPLLVLWAAVTVVLAVACVNLAGLTFARGTSRAREIATRLALGSGRRAIVRQLLVESALLGIAGGAAGLLSSGLVLRELTTLAADALDLWQPIALDGRAMLAAAVFALIATAVTGIAPALQATSDDVQRRLAAGSSRAVAGGASQLPRRVIVVTQVALGVMLLVGAGLLVRTFAHLRSLEPGFDGRGVHAATVSLQDARYSSAADVQRLVAATLDTLRRDGVEAAGASLGLPYERLLNLSFRHLDGPNATASRMTSATYVAGDYFGALRIPVRAGRTFDSRDTAGAAGAVIVNATLAKEYFGAIDPIGRRIALAGREREIVGVVGDVQLRPGFGDRGPLAAMPLAYLPLSQVSDGTLRLVHGWFATAFVIRGAGDTAAAGPRLQTALASVDPLLPVAEVRSMSDVQDEAVALPRLLMSLLVALAVAAVGLTAIGIHGLISSTVSERTREMGIRMALGATRATAVRTLALPGILLATGGVALGVIAARAATGLLQAFVWGVRTTDPWTFASASLLIVAVASVASLAPALRILRLDPARTLRQD